VLHRLGAQRDILDERASESDVQDLDAPAHAEDREAAVERLRKELELEGVASGIGDREQLVRLLAVPRRLDVAPSAEEDPVADGEGLPEALAVEPGQHEGNAARKSDRALMPHPGIVAEVEQAHRETDDRFSEPVPHVSNL
jgi:hypothetical protein